VLLGHDTGGCAGFQVWPHCKTQIGYHTRGKQNPVTQQTVPETNMRKPGVGELTVVGVLAVFLLMTMHGVVLVRANYGVTKPVCCTGARFGWTICTQQVGQFCYLDGTVCYFSSKASICEAPIAGSDFRGDYMLYKAYAEDKPAAVPPLHGMRAEQRFHGYEGVLGLVLC
jgi:hypothetical protein